MTEPHDPWSADPTGQPPPPEPPPYPPWQQSAQPGMPSARWYSPTSPGAAPYAYGARGSRPGLGAGGFVVVVCMSVATLVLSHLAGHDLGVLMLTVGTTTLDPAQIRATDPALAQRLSTWLLLGLIASLIGMGGWIAAIVAVHRRSARPVAIAAIVLGVVAPVLGIAMMIAAAIPFLSQIPQ